MDTINAALIPSMTIEDLQATLLSVLAGDLKAKDGALVPSGPTPTGPRGPTAKVTPRLEAARDALLSMSSGEGGATAKALLDESNGRFVYTDILLVARQEIAKGTIIESRKGRKATWIRPA